MSKPGRRPRGRPESKAPGPRTRLIQQAEERAERLTTLSRLTRLVTSATDSDAVFRGIAEAASTLLKAKMAYVWVDVGGEKLREAGSFWADPRLATRAGVTLVPVSRKGSLSAFVLQSHRPEYVEDVQRDPRWLNPRLATEADLHACIAQPLLHQERAVGALIVAFGRRSAFTPEERNLCGLLADQAAIAIENARLYEETERRRREAELLAAVVRTINTSLDLATVLQRIAEGAREICRSDMSFVGLRDLGTDSVEFRHWPGARYQGYRSMRIAPGQGAAGLVLVTGHPFRTDSYLEDPRISPTFTAIAREEGMRAYMAVPVKIEERVEGFLAVSNRDARLLTDRDEQILLGLADHAAVAIGNARLFADNAARRHEAEALAELGAAITSSLELQKILSFVVDRACALLGTQRSAVALVNTDDPNGPLHFLASRGMSRAFPADMRPDEVATAPLPRPSPSDDQSGRPIFSTIRGSTSCPRRVQRSRPRVTGRCCPHRSLSVTASSARSSRIATTSGPSPSGRSSSCRRSPLRRRSRWRTPDCSRTASSAGGSRRSSPTSPERSPPRSTSTRCFGESPTARRSSWAATWR